MKSLDCYSIYSSEGKDTLVEKLTSIKEELEKVEAPDFSQEKSEESEEESEEDENWGEDDVDL